MKKTVKKLGLTRETLRGLDGRSVKDIAGGDTVMCYGSTDTVTCAFCGPTPVEPGVTLRANCWAN